METIVLPDIPSVQANGLTHIRESEGKGVRVTWCRGWAPAAAGATPLGWMLVRVSRAPSLCFGGENASGTQRRFLPSFRPRPISSLYSHHCPYHSLGQSQRNLRGRRARGPPPLPHLVYPGLGRKSGLWGGLTHLYRWWWPARANSSEGKGLPAFIM